MQEAIKIRSKKHPDVVLHTIPGHFVTPNSHVNYFLDMTTLKSRLSEASAAARALGEHISPTTIVDTIVCIEGCGNSWNKRLLWSVPPPAKRQ